MPPVEPSRSAPAGARGGVLRRLARDKKGNTLAIVGAALVPLTAMIGSGVDMSRAYMAKTRLQSACDAAALAGRRVMVADQMSDAVRDEARRFFNFNFQQGLYQTAAFTPAVSRSGVGTIKVVASTTIPVTIMRLFGYENLPLNVECDASLNYVNTDIMLVLDTTGSMLCTPEESSNCGRTTEIATSRIVALRDASMALYDALAPTQAQLEAAGMRLRYGAVPYSSSVNVGNLIRTANASYLASNVEHQTVVANYNTPVDTPMVQPPEPPVEQIFRTRSLSQAECDYYGRNQSFTDFTPEATSGGGPAPQRTWTRSFANNEAAGVDWGWSGAGDTSGNNRTCRRRYVETDTTYVREYAFTNVSYEGESINVGTFNSGLPDRIATNFTSPDIRVSNAGPYDLTELAEAGRGVVTANSAWNGCVMERNTVSTITSSSGYSIPSDAYDLDINRIPNSDETRWRAMWPEITYRRAVDTNSASSADLMGSLNRAWWACPSEARRLQPFTRTGLQTFVDDLRAEGGTYHDIGMIWGSRMISSAGIFADSPDTFNNMPVSRHLIFMTDDQLAPNCDSYSAYGIERNEKRVKGGGCASSSDADLTARHLQRFRMICNAAKGMNVSIWVIAFGTSLSSDMQNCASNPNQASTSANRAALIQRFTEIGQNIGALRLVQ